MKGSRPTLEDTRCTVCSRFIPRGFTARLSNGSVQCLTHPIGTVSIDKGGLPAELPPPETSMTRRETVKAAVRERRMSEPGAVATGFRSIHMEIL